MRGARRTTTAVAIAFILGVMPLGGPALAQSSDEDLAKQLAEQWTVPINLTVSQLLRLASQVISLTLGGRYYAERPTGGPDWGIRFVVTFLFPKK